MGLIPGDREKDFYLCFDFVRNSLSFISCTFYGWIINQASPLLIPHISFPLTNTAVQVQLGK